jgi:hypothetical protein
MPRRLVRRARLSGRQLWRMASATAIALGVTANAKAIDGGAELLEVIADMEFGEQQIDQAPQPGQAVRLIEERTKDL